TEFNSISARSGCPSEDSTVSLPNPAAFACEHSIAETMATLSVFKPNETNFGLLFECIFFGIEGHSTGENHLSASCSPIYRCMTELSPYHHGLRRASVTNLLRCVKPAGILYRTPLAGFI